MTQAIDGLNEAVGRVVAVLAVVFAGIIIYDVTMRYAFNDPTRWAFDVSKQIYGFYFIMLGGYALRHGAHVRVDVLTRALPARIERWVSVAGYLLFFFPFTVVFAQRTYVFAATSFRQGEVTYGAVQMPVYPLKMAMFVAAVLLLLQGLSEVAKLIFTPAEERDDGR